MRGGWRARRACRSGQADRRCRRARTPGRRPAHATGQPGVAAGRQGDRSKRTMPRRHLDLPQGIDRPTAQQPEAQRQVVILRSRHVGCRRIRRCREAGMHAELIGELISLRRLGVAPHLLQGNHIGVDSAHRLQQGRLPILPIWPEPPPDVPGHDLDPPRRDDVHGESTPFRVVHRNRFTTRAYRRIRRSVLD